MLIRNNNETKLNEYIDFLSDKGKIIKIKDTSKNTEIRFSNGIIFYFLLIVSIILILLTIYIIGNRSSIDSESDNIIVIGTALFTSIVIGVTLNEKSKIKLNIVYPNENQIKINNKIFDIEKEQCNINIIKKYEYNPRFKSESGHTIFPESRTIKYFLKIKGTGKLKSFQITKGIEEQLEEFIYNFEYEILDVKMKASEFIQNVQDIREELYENGYISQDKLNKLYEYKKKNK